MVMNCELLGMSVEIEKENSMSMKLTLEMEQEPTRDYLAEALAIVNGETMLRASKPHLEAVVKQMLDQAKPLRPPFDFEIPSALGFSNDDCRFILCVLIGWFGEHNPRPEASREFANAMNYAQRLMP